MPREKGVCKICKKEKIVQFLTPRLSICNLCLSIVRGKNINFEDFENIFIEIIKRNFPYTSYDSFQHDAEKVLIEKMNGIEKLISFFFKSSEYIKKHKTLAVDLQNKSNEKVDRIRKEEYEKLLKGEYTPDDITQKEKYFLWIYRAYVYFLLSENRSILERPSEELWGKIRKHIIFTDGHKCNKCKKENKNLEYHLHHIIPLQEYGTNHENNLVLLCHSCHQRQHKGFKISKNKTKQLKKTTQQNCIVRRKDFLDINNEDIAQFYCPSCQEKILVYYKKAWMPAYCRYCGFEFETREDINDELQIRTQRTEKMIIPCPQCKQKLRIKCGTWLNVYCPSCYIEFEFFGSYNKFDYEIRTATKFES